MTKRFFLHYKGNGVFASEFTPTKGSRTTVMKDNNPQAPAARAAVNAVMDAARHNDRVVRMNADVAAIVTRAVEPFGYRAEFCAGDLRLSPRICVLGQSPKTET